MTRRLAEALAQQPAGRWSTCTSPGRWRRPIFGDAAELARHTAAAMPLLSDHRRPLSDRRRRTCCGRWLSPRRLRAIRAGRPRPAPGRAGRDDRLAGRARRRRAGQLPAPAAAGRGRTGLGHRRLPGRRRTPSTRPSGRSATRQRPWHRALILERAARFHLAHGMDHTGYDLLAEARRGVPGLGRHREGQTNSTGPTRPLRNPAPAVRADTAPTPPADLRTRRSNIMTGSIDLLGILAASQALSSETSIDGLRARVVEVLSAMTGATGVHLLLWDDERAAAGCCPPRATAPCGPLDDAGRRAPACRSSVVRYAERTREPLVVTDATRDDRFARDPYLAGPRLAAPCSPSRSSTAARCAPCSLLENRLIRGAFSTERLDGVMLIAGQLAVSLDNALVYASLERKVAERTHQLGQANQRLRTALHHRPAHRSGQPPPTRRGPARRMAPRRNAPATRSRSP